MSDKSVWVGKRTLGDGRTTYHLRWYCPQTGKLCSKKSKATTEDGAKKEAGKLEAEIAEGRAKPIRKATWAEFVAEHCKLIAGARHRDEAERTLEEFGETFTASPDRATFAVVEGYADWCKAAGNGQATINKKLRYLRAAFNKAVRRGYAKQNPMDGWTWTTAKRPTIRTASAAEQKAILKAANDTHGLPMFSFVYTALYTGGRKGELLGLSWDDIDFEGRRLVFRDTKSHEDREIMLTAETVGVLLGLRRNFTAVLAGGPFRGLGDIDRKWRDDVRQKAGVDDLTIHDLRRTFITRLIRNGVPLPTVQRMAGHAKIQTTLEYYNSVNDGDRRDAVATLRPAATKAG